MTGWTNWPSGWMDDCMDLREASLFARICRHSSFTICNVRHVMQVVQVAHRNWVLLDMVKWYSKHGQFWILWFWSYTCCTELLCDISDPKSFTDPTSLHTRYIKSMLKIQHFSTQLWLLSLIAFASDI
jgi:hypothetical protein